MSLSDILDIERDRIRRERVIILTVFERLRNRLKYTVRAGEKFCLYEIPGFIPGYPLIDIERTMIYLVKKLRKEGFIVIPVTKDTLLVTWDTSDLRKLDEKKKASMISTEKTESPVALNDALVKSLLAAKK